MKNIARILLMIFVVTLFGGCGKEKPSPNMADVNGKEIRDRADKAWKEIK